VLIFIGFGCGPALEPIAGGKPVDHWIEASQNEDPKVRVEAIKKLGNIGNKVPEAISTIIDALADKSAAVRKEAIYAVVRNRRACAAAVPILDEMKDNDPDPAIRKIADEAYENLSIGS
jgi:HEAT repeat protein